MDPDVIEIPPSTPNLVSRSKTKRLAKHKQIILPEVIDVDKDEDSVFMILDKKNDSKNKGKAVTDHDDCNQMEDALDNHIFDPIPVSNNIINLDGYSSDLSHDEDGNDIYEDYIGDLEYDDYASLQVHFDNVDIPPGVEAPIPWLPDSLNNSNGSDSFNSSNLMHSNSASIWSSKPKASSATSSTFSIPMEYMSHASGLNLSPPWPISQPAESKKKSTASQNGGKGFIPLPFQSQKASVSSSHSTDYGSGNHLNKVMPSHGVGQGSWAPDLNNQSGGTNLFYPSIPTPMGGLDHSPGLWPSMSSYTSKLNSSSSNYTNYPYLHNPFPFANIPPPDDAAVRTPKTINTEDILRKFLLFKRFDTVEDHSDHHYACKGFSTKQPPKAWAKRIQEEWRILENDLPDTIFVRVYETRMDILRAVIIGAEGTPYHDGLFFFDIFFPAGYPKVPPHVYYHSRGLRLNPNLYSCGKVCLSLLGTWSGSKNEKWLPGISTVLQVLVSIQALILNQKPYFNEPGYERMSGSANGEKQSQEYNESTFFLSLKTMVYTIRSPPKHFEDFVLGHFHGRAHDILVACKAYMDGAQVGSLVKGGVQDVDESDKSCSIHFKNSLPVHVDMLVKEFLHIGVKGIEEFQTLAKVGNAHSCG